MGRWLGRLVGRVKLKYIRNTYSPKSIRNGWVDSWVKGRKVGRWRGRLVGSLAGGRTYLLSKNIFIYIPYFDFGSN